MKQKARSTSPLAKSAMPATTPPTDSYAVEQKPSWATMLSISGAWTLRTSSSDTRGLSMSRTLARARSGPNASGKSRSRLPTVM